MGGAVIGSRLPTCYNLQTSKSNRAFGGVANPLQAIKGNAEPPPRSFDDVAKDVDSFLDKSAADNDKFESEHQGYAAAVFENGVRVDKQDRLNEMDVALFEPPPPLGQSQAQVDDLVEDIIGRPPPPATVEAQLNSQELDQSLSPDKAHANAVEEAEKLRSLQTP